jgi:hypothetical protein
MQFRRPAPLAIAAIAALGLAFAGCAATVTNRLLGGNADGVAIRFAGDIGATLPLAQQHCAQYERVPQLRDTSDDIVNYACIRR